ncbi:Stp1/IreP family PP2C-type Ser/Thr phosphatase [Pajaroellobacter abortibovis]|uniref:PPM-type phosphatase domain-containing protein n=1 Tax=Pajaroellobacter abortibovis TaxID=1882918 RepID=A0A1L6MXJ3_9BACT|nr:Stp1/IreP family PP2C-type Ser/Thr phosphatase [Pajaroellobacter abortibovis]APS00217.1 hypothetical protein BCY86_05625 [Pajaroellobacter abortibovis]
MTYIPESVVKGEVHSAVREKFTSGNVYIRFHTKTDVGQVRKHNEDNFLLADITRKIRQDVNRTYNYLVGEQGALFAVCDGMGGAAAGEIASQLAVDVLYQRMTENLSTNAPLLRDELAYQLIQAIQHASFQIFQEAAIDKTRRGMGTTITAAALVDDCLFLAQVGDSRGYIFRQGRLVQVTRDQSLVNQLIEAGQLTEAEAKNFELNNIILQALGTSESVQVDLTYVPLYQQDTLLLCSDGLSGMLESEEIETILAIYKDPEEICKVLVEQANQAGGQDNITVIIVQFNGDGLSPPNALQENPQYCKYAFPETYKPSSQQDEHLQNSAHNHQDHQQFQLYPTTKPFSHHSPSSSQESSPENPNHTFIYPNQLELIPSDSFSDHPPLKQNPLLPPFVVESWTPSSRKRLFSQNPYVNGSVFLLLLGVIAILILGSLAFSFC